MKSEVKARLVKPCPCCGSKNINMDNPKWIKKNDLHSVSIMCKNCRLEVSGYAGWDFVEKRDYTLEEAYQSALLRWNRRVA